MAAPLGGCVWLAVWLRDAFSLGDWVVWAGAAFGAVCAVEGLRSSLKVLDRLAKDKDDGPGDVFFNDHT